MYTTKQVSKNQYVTLLNNTVLPTLVLHKYVTKPVQLASTTKATISTIFNPTPEQLANFNNLLSPIKYQYASKKDLAMQEANTNFALAIFS